MKTITAGVALSPERKRTLDALIKTGRWNNYSEIFRYGLTLVEAEVRAGHLAPIREGELARAYAQQTREEKAQETKLAKASLRHRPGQRSR